MKARTKHQKKMVDSFIWLFEKQISEEKNIYLFKITGFENLYSSPSDRKYTFNEMYSIH